MSFSQRSLRGACVILLVMSALALLGVKRPAGLGDVAAVRTWSYPDYTRVVVELTRSVSTQVVSLPANPKAGRPDRLYLDLDGIWVGLDYEDGIPIGDGLLQGVRLGQNTLRRSRLVIDLQSYDHYRLLHLRSPNRVVIDVFGRRSPAKGTEVRRSKGATNGSRLSMPLRQIETVVVDPGHGGKDPGAIGVGGLREKDINLRISRLLGEKLERRGFKVVYTRDRDRSVSLEERTVIAEASGGDLFVSIHANASRRKKTRGIEVYYLDVEYERHSLEVAARENDIPPEEVDSLQHTMAQLRVGESSLHSGRLAQLVHDALVPGLSEKYRGVPDLGVKKGPFYVLFMSSMPSILLESGFLTNRQDAKLLSDDRFLDALATRVADGLVRYRDLDSRIAVTQTPRGLQRR